MSFFHTGIIESDDIAEVSHEIDKALNFSKKCSMLVDSVKEKYNLVSLFPCFISHLCFKSLHY